MFSGLLYLLRDYTLETTLKVSKEGATEAYVCFRSQCQQPFLTGKPCNEKLG